MKKSFRSSLKPKVSIIVVNYNTREIVLKCLEQIAADSLLPPAEVIVVDNASEDGSAEAIEDKFPGVYLIRNKVNKGLGAADNMGLAMAGGDYIMLLNTDAFVSRGSVKKLIDYMDEHRRVGAIAPRLLDADGTTQPSCFSALTVRSVLGAYWTGQREKVEKYYPRGGKPTEVEAVVVSAVVIRRKLLASLGGEDERYFLYFQDLDLCRRLGKLGWKIVYLPSAAVLHLHGASGQSEVRFGYLRESLLYPFKKMFGLWRSESSQARIVEDSIRYFGWLGHLLITVTIKFTGR